MNRIRVGGRGVIGLWTVTLLFAVLVVYVVGSAARAAAAPPAACTSEQGVVVAVDFGHWGGAVQRGCDPSPSTGYNALLNAGFGLQGTQHDGPAFICRINNEPPPSDEACVLTPPASAYWSYWHADPGQSGWSYSQLGAMSYRPKQGSVDAWVFGSTDIGGTRGGPSFSPDTVRAAPPAPVSPTTAAAPAPTAPASAPPDGSGAGATPAVDPGTPGHASSTPAASRSMSPGAASSGSGSESAGAQASPSADPAASESAASSAPPPSIGANPSGAIPSIVDVAPTTASAQGGSGSPIGLIVAACVCLVLVAGAGLLTWRARQGARDAR